MKIIEAIQLKTILPIQKKKIASESYSTFLPPIITKIDQMNTKLFNCIDSN